MGIVKTKDLIYNYIRRDEEDQVEEVLEAVKQVNIDIKEGEFVAVLGHNGSGKSTLAKHINALLLPTEGTVWIDGKDTKDESALWQIRQTAGMVFQNPDNQIIASVVEEDVGFGPENIGVPTEEIWKRVDECLGAVDMKAYRKQSPNKLSGGQKQRVAIAGVMAMEPRCIVLDEPTAMLDPNGRHEVIRTIRELNKKKGITIILITHYMEEVIHADRIYVMDDGEVAMEGTPEEIFSQVEKLKELRLDVPQVTELAHELRQKGVPLPPCILDIDTLVKELVKVRAGK
ncbi:MULTISPECIES: energy-coupling factor transporter ATPase [unclassified Candidatus Paralachnospira]|uniref:energy-coupling factor transporter ATPase n=1 Tax=unclassified Candidatus Paralachnospira TaxID=3099471 RepID=UPI003F90BFD1